MAQIITCDGCGVELARFVGMRPVDEKSRHGVIMRVRFAWGDDGCTLDVCEPCMKKLATTIPQTAAHWPTWLRQVVASEPKG